MNFLKSLFIPLYMMALLGSAAYGIAMLAQGAPAVPWAGVLLTTAPMLAFLGYTMLTHKVARTSARLPGIALLGLGGGTLSAGAWAIGDANALPAVGGLVGFLAYAHWYSDLDRSPGKVITVGRTLPEFALKGIAGAWVSSSSLVGRPTILIFFRGNWCPLCMAQIQEIAARYQELGRLGVRVALISPQPHDNTVQLAKRYVVNFQFLTDERNVAARTLGIAAPWSVPMGMQMLGYDSESVLPTVIITDASGKVIWVHETDNYRVRPEPDTFLQVLRGNGIVAAT